MVGDGLRRHYLGEIAAFHPVHRLEVLGMNCRTRDTGTTRPPAECLQHAALVPRPRKAVQRYQIAAPPIVILNEAAGPPREESESDFMHLTALIPIVPV